MKHTWLILVFTLTLLQCKNKATILNKRITKGTTMEQDNQTLSGLMQEIQDISNSASCTDPSEWKTTPIGAKACGGPTGFIPYSTKINTTAFLEKVAHYTSQQKVYNAKWGVVSDCSIPAAPQGVRCENGKPVLAY